MSISVNSESILSAPLTPQKLGHIFLHDIPVDYSIDASGVNIFITFKSTKIKMYHVDDLPVIIKNLKKCAITDPQIQQNLDYLQRLDQQLDHSCWRWWK